MKRLLALLAFALLLPTAGAAPPVPSLHDIYSAAATGHLQQAQSEVNQVLSAYPNSGKAHFVDARILALRGRWPEAAAELATAQRLDPGLPFERKETLAAFQRQIASHVAQTSQNSRAFPFLGLIGGALALLAVFLLIAAYRRSQRQQPVQVVTGWPNANSAPPFGGQPGAFPQAPTPGAGGSFLGAVGTGLGMGAGFAAGEMLVDRLFDQHQSGMVPETSINPGENMTPTLPDDQDFGINDPGGWDDGSALGGSDDSSNWS